MLSSVIYPVNAEPPTNAVVKSSIPKMAKNLILPKEAANTVGFSKTRSSKDKKAKHNITPVNNV